MTTTYKDIDRNLIAPSKTNDRTEFVKMEELASSFNAGGVKVPLIVRPKGKAGHYEIVCGERRWRASGMSGAEWPNLPLAKLPCIVKDLTDAEALDYQTDENLNRNDLTPLELAKRFRRYIDQKLNKHAAENIAAKHGYSASWVWDVMKILALVPLGKKLIQQGRMTLNHAILIARQTKEDQERILEPRSGALFQSEESYGFNFDGGDEARQDDDPYRGLKTRSVRELKAWIAKYIRFDVKQAVKAAPLEFEPIAEAVAAAEAEPGRGRKVIAITHSSFVALEARDGEGERTYGPMSWKRADGSDKQSPVCEHSVLGEVVVGPEYGSAFRVCIARDKCTTHFGDVIKAKKKRETERASGKAPDQNAEQKKRVAEQRRLQLLEQQNKARWAVVYPLIEAEIMARYAKLPPKLPAPLFRLVLNQAGLPSNIGFNDLAKAILSHRTSAQLQRSWHYWDHGARELRSLAETFGVNLAKIDAAAIKELNATEVIVTKERFEEIEATSCTESSGEDRVSHTFVHNGRLMASTGGLYGPDQDEREAFEMVPRSEFKGKAERYSKIKQYTRGRANPAMEKRRNQKLGFYHGLIVDHGGAEYVMVGPPVTFILKGKKKTK